MCFDLTKMTPKIKVQMFFFFWGVMYLISSFRASLGEIWRKMVLEVV